MEKITKIRVKRPDGSFTDPTPLGADSVNVTMRDGHNLEESMNNIVKVSNTQPTQSSNKIWVQNNNVEIEIPTMEDIDEIVEEHQVSVYNAIQDLGHMVAEEYSSENEYNIGDLVMKDGILLKCISHVPERTLWNVSNWEPGVVQKQRRGSIRYDIQQNLTDAEKQQARENIDAVKLELASTLNESGKAADSKIVGDNLQILKDDFNKPITPDKLRDAQNYGDLIQYQGAEIIQSKYVWGVDGNRVSIANNSNYNYVVIDVVPDKVYRFHTVSWWAVTDENDIVVYGCGGNGTSTDNVDTTGVANAKKLYVSLPKTATQVYVIDNNDGVIRFEWSLNGFVSTKNNNVFAIPDFKFITGKAWPAYFSGSWLRNAEYQKTNFGYEQFADHFTYRSGSASAVNSRIRLYDNNFNEFDNHLIRMQYASPNYRNLTALFIGDSTINNGGLTAKVLETFADNNVVCALLGTTGSGDNKREGRSGWSAKDYCGLTSRGQDTAQNPFYNPITQAFDFNYYMTNQGYSAPDFVFIQLGVNDMFGVSMANFETGYTAFKDCMLAIVNSIHDYNNSVKIVVNLITMPNGNISEFNRLYGCNYYNWERRYIDIKANSRLIADLPTYVIKNPHNMILNPMTDISDDVHPTAAGYATLGEFDADIMFAN